MPALRVFTLPALIFFLGLTAMACSSHPGFVFRLPKEVSGKSGAGANPAPLLPGTWVRLVESRYSVANPEVYWKGREWIEITARLDDEGRAAGFTYEKHHLYAEYYRGSLRSTAYRESGALILKRPWILFQPKSALVWREKRVVNEEEKKAFDSSRRILLPDLNAPEVKDQAKKVSPRTLRFFYNQETRGTPEQGTLRKLNFITPLTYERFGRVFEHGVYEGCTEPCDPESGIFRAALRRYNVNSYHRHGYEKRVVRPGGVF